MCWGQKGNRLAPRLVRGLKHDDFHVRHSVVLTLFTMGSEVQPLLKTLLADLRPSGTSTASGRRSSRRSITLSLSATALRRRSRSCPIPCNQKARKPTNVSKRTTCSKQIVEDRHTRSRSYLENRRFERKMDRGRARQEVPNVGDYGSGMPWDRCQRCRPRPWVIYRYDAKPVRLAAGKVLERTTLSWRRQFARRPMIRRKPIYERMNTNFAHHKSPRRCRKRQGRHA